MRRNGFTLVELVVVLVVIAVLTHLAVRELSQVRAAQLRKAADRQLEEIRAAVWSAAPGADPAGFLADMGRLPRPLAETNGAHDVAYTLGELWRLPDGAAPFAVLPATAANLRVPDGAKADLADAGVFVPTGWRGPYLRLPAGRARLLDPWGNPLELEDDAGYARLSLTNGFVSAVRHFGADARPDAVRAPGSPAARDGEAELAPDGGAASRLVVTCEFPDGGAPAAIDWAWYGPADGGITGAVAKAQSPYAPVTFEGLTPGVRLLKDSCSKTARPVLVRPGDNLVHLKLRPRILP